MPQFEAFVVSSSPEYGMLTADAGEFKRENDSMSELTKEFWLPLTQEPVLPRPLRGKRRGERNRGHGKVVMLRTANADDRSKIPLFFSNTGEHQFLDVPPSGIDGAIDQWFERQHAGFIVEVGGDAAGFVNIEPIGPPESEDKHLELGRIVISPKWRRKGIATAVLRHLLLGIAAQLDKSDLSAAKDKSIFLRTLVQNQPALAIFEKLPVREAPDPREQRDPDLLWFYPYDRAKRRLLAQRVAGLREQRDLSQKELAYFSGASESQIAMIEAGIREPSLPLVRSLWNVLCRAEPERLALLYSLVAEEKPEHVVSASSLDHAVSLSSESLWVFTDVLAEHILPSALESSREAVRRGYARYYFVPPGFSLPVLKDLVESIKTGLTASPQRLEQLVQVYSAPPPLCALRLAIHAPSLNSAREITVAGPGQSRIRIDMDQAPQIVTQVLSYVTAYPRSKTIAEHDGFRRLIPEEA